MKTTHRARLDAVLSVLICFCAVPQLLQLVTIPSSLMLIKPVGLECAFYGASRAGWGCSSLADVATNPLPAVVGLVVTSVLFLLLRVGRSSEFPWRYLIYLFAVQALYVCGVALLVRVLAVVGGRADALFLVAALPMVVVALAAWLLLRFARPLTGC